MEKLNQVVAGVPFEGTGKVIAIFEDNMLNSYFTSLPTEKSETNTVLKLGDKVYSDFYGHGKIIMEQKKKLCFKVRFDDGRFNEFTRNGDYLINLHSEKAKEMNNRRKIRKV